MARAAAQVARIGGGRRLGENPSAEGPRVVIEEAHLLAPLHPFEAAVEIALERVDGGGIEPLEARVLDHLIHPVLSLDEEIEPALAVVDVEGEEEGGPVGNGGRGRASGVIVPL